MKRNIGWVAVRHKVPFQRLGAVFLTTVMPHLKAALLTVLRPNTIQWLNCQIRSANQNHTLG